MNQLKTLLKKLLSDLRSADLRNPAVLAAAILFLSVPVVIGSLAYLEGSKAKNDIRSSSVMITTRGLNHGGTGIILQSTPSQTNILTNDHVCRAIKSGGVVRSINGDYQIASIIESQASDLCLVQVTADLGVNTKISELAPKFYDDALVSGHPALMPNVISTGHVSGRSIIQVNTGMRACTEEDMKDPQLGLICAFLGAVPVIKSYESVLVTATIMPGSSGSGVYNKNKELSGVVFAGSSEFGYAWTVPYEQVLNFLNKEHTKLVKQDISQEVSLFGNSQEKRSVNEALRKCNKINQFSELLDTNEKVDTITNICNILKRDMIFRD